MNETITKKTLRKWQNRLGLGDWHVTLDTNVRANHMKADNAVGCTQYTASLKEARIQIITEMDVAYDFGRKFDELETFVHEMLEIKFSILRPNDDSIEDKLIHQLIDDLARALVDAERSKS